MNHPLRNTLLCVGLVAALAACGSNKASVREPAKLQDIANYDLKPVKSWNVQAGDGSGGRVSGLRLNVQADALYTADIDGRVFAYARDTGELLWKTSTGARISSGPSVSGDAVVVGTLDAEVISLKRADGSERWRRAMSSEVLSPPVADGDVVVARSIDGRVFGLSAAEGERVWSFDRAVPSLILRGGSAPLVVDGRVLIGMDNGRVAGLRLSDGKALWEQPVAVPTGRTELERLSDVDADLVDGPDCVIAASFGGELACLNMGSGETMWRRAIRSYSGMVVSEDKLFVTDDSGVVWALDLRTGAAAWKQDALLYRRLSAPGYFDGHVVVGDMEGYVHWIDPSSGAIVARVRSGSDPIMTAPVAGEGLLYVMNSVGRIAAFEKLKPKS
ncbi:MAG: outer membrane protein assembly factor BamB [Panacagrimonas sp.]